MKNFLNVLKNFTQTYFGLAVSLVLVFALWALHGFLIFESVVAFTSLADFIVLLASAFVVAWLFLQKEYFYSLLAVFLSPSTYMHYESGIPSLLSGIFGGGGLSLPIAIVTFLGWGYLVLSIAAYLLDKQEFKFKPQTFKDNFALLLLFAYIYVFVGLFVPFYLLVPVLLLFFSNKFAAYVTFAAFFLGTILAPLLQLFANNLDQLDAMHLLAWIQLPLAIAVFAYFLLATIKTYKEA